MIWIFVTIGMLAFASAVHGALTAVTEDGRDAVGRMMHGIAGLLLIGAWATGHVTGIGWGCLAVAAAMEVGLRARSREFERRIAAQQAAREANPAIHLESDPPRGDGRAIRAATVRERRATPSAADGSGMSENATAGESPGAGSAPAPMPPFVTVVLLREAHQVTGDVFVASLRRAGRRDAQLTSAGSATTWQVRIGDLTMEGSNQRGPLAADDLSEAAAQTFDWPEALETCRDHAGHIRLVTRASANASRAELVAVHRVAHEAIAEFAPVCGVLWEAARLLRPIARKASRGDHPRQLPSGQDPARDAVHDAMETCINFRVTPIEADESGLPRFVSDTVGLCAFGLPDIEIVTPGEPDERIARVLFHLAEEFFASGCDWQDGDAREIGPHGQWRCERRRSLLPPGREVAAFKSVE